MPFPLSEEQLIRTEQALGRRFPDDYRVAMQRRNGGELTIDSEAWFLHPLQDTSDRKRIRRTANHVLYETSRAREWSGFPRHAVSIAEDGSGNHLIFLADSSDSTTYGAMVFRWDHETRGVTELGTFGDLAESTG